MARIINFVSDLEITNTNNNGVVDNQNKINNEKLLSDTSSTINPLADKDKYWKAKGRKPKWVIDLEANGKDSKL